MNRIILIFAFILSLSAWGKYSSPVVIIYVDQKTEKELGTFPFSRTYYGEAIKILNKNHNPKFIVIKMFLDLPRPEDKKLIEELKKHRNVFTQAYKDEKEIWIPKGEMAEAFAGIGLVNGSLNEKGEVKGLYLIVKDGVKTYESLPLMLAKKYLGKDISPEMREDGLMPLPALPYKLPWKTYSFIDLLKNKIKKDELKDKVVFFYHDGKKNSPLKTIDGRSVDQAQLIALIFDELIK